MKIWYITQGAADPNDQIEMSNYFKKIERILTHQMHSLCIDSYRITSIHVRNVMYT